MIQIEDVIEGCRNGDKAMQKELYDRYNRRFYALCRRYASDEESAREILVDGFITIYKKIDGYRGEGSFEGWMCTIFLRTAIAYYRDYVRRRDTIKPIEDVEYEQRCDIAQQIDIRDALIAALRKLTKRERIVFNLIAVDEYTMKEVGDELGITESTAKSHYYNAIETLRKILIKRLGPHYLNN